MSVIQILAIGIATVAIAALIGLKLRALKALRTGGSEQSFAVRVGEIKNEAEGIKSFRLEPQAGVQLPSSTPGSHVRVWLEGGLVRHYSICNPSSEPDHYRIAVKLEEPSRGGSKAMHRLSEGDILKISKPSNAFELVEGASDYLLFAGGIGITPILSMVFELERRGASYRLHYFARSIEHAAFYCELSKPGLAKHVSFHFGVEPEAVRPLLWEAVRGAGDGAHLYMCGPSPFMDALEEAALAVLKPNAVHRESFAADQTLLAGPCEDFEVELARSGKTIFVPKDSSILEALGSNGFEVEHCCKEGVCGTCLTNVLEGEPDHRDSFLTQSERKAGDRILICVSRSKTGKLVLEL